MTDVDGLGDGSSAGAEKCVGRRDPSHATDRNTSTPSAEPPDPARQRDLMIARPVLLQPVRADDSADAPVKLEALPVEHRVTSCGRPAPPPDTVTELRPVRAAVAELRRLGCVTEVHVRSLSRHHSQPEPTRPARLTPGTEWTVLHRVRPRRRRVGVRVQATAEFNGDDWRFVVRVDHRGHGCPITRLAGNVSDWFAQAAWHLGDLPGNHAPGSAGLSVLTSVAHLGSGGEERQAYAALAELVTGDDRARWSSELVNGTLVCRGDYETTDVGSTTHHGHRMVMFASAAFAIGEQYDADGAAVWRHAGTLAELAARLQALPRPGEKGAPTRALSHARAFSRDLAVTRPPHSLWRRLDG